MVNSAAGAGADRTGSISLPFSIQITDALAHGASAAPVHYNLSLVHHARHDDAAAAASLRQALQADPDYKEALEFQKHLGR